MINYRLGHSHKSFTSLLYQPVCVDLDSSSIMVSSLLSPSMLLNHKGKDL
jgi:hypothetical protein